MPASHARSRSLLVIPVLCCLVAPRPAGAASIGLTGSVADPVVVSGGSTQLSATVQNTGGSGGGDLNYTVDIATPGVPYSASDVLAPGASDTWLATYDSTGQPYGANTTSVTVTDPGATNSPQSILLGVTVLAHATPYVFFGTGPLQPLGAQEPPVDPLAFGATGGGEFFAAAGIVNDPPYPTAGLDLDSIVATGDSQIRTDLTPFANLAASDNPADGHLFNIMVSLAAPGTFTKTFQLYFSDQNLPGASAPGSVATSFTVVATVLPVPEPTTAGLLAIGLAALVVAKRRSERPARPF